GNILFRPVGQIALANALGILTFRKQLSLKSIFEKLRRFDVDEGFSHMENSESPWYGILYDPNKKRMLVSGRELASKLIVYLVAGIEDDMERAHLRQAVAAARTFEGKAISFNGRFVRPQEVGLPPVLS
ncbi:MAG: DGQHR domain-containing protein, partial [Microcoleus sp.]